MSSEKVLAWIKDESNPRLRSWEEFYRNRWQHDKIVRSTHGVNCTGGCSWQIHVKDGIVVWETQAYDELAKRRLRVLPGMTGLWQVSGRSDVSSEQRFALDLYYIEHWSLGLDLEIIIKTPAVMAFGKGAY